MKKQIRRGVFETNSSSTHSLTMCSESEYDKWKKGELLFSDCDEEFYTREDAIEKLKDSSWLNERVDWNNKDSVNDALYDEQYYTYEQYQDYVGEYYSSFKVSHTTKSGDKVIAFGYYGYGY